MLCLSYTYNLIFFISDLGYAIWEVNYFWVRFCLTHNVGISYATCVSYFMPTLSYTVFKLTYVRVRYAISELSYTELSHV